MRMISRRQLYCKAILFSVDPYYQECIILITATLNNNTCKTSSTVKFLNISGGWTWFKQPAADKNSL